MATQPVTLNEGHNEIVQDVWRCRVRYDVDTHLATLELELQFPQHIKTVHQQATKVDVHLPQMVAAKLLLDLHKIAGETSWPLELAIGEPAEFPTGFGSDPKR
jgi:hypothetical protein